MPDFIAKGGGHCSFLENRMRINTDQMIRDLIIDCIIERNKQKIEIQTTKDGRLTLE